MRLFQLVLSLAAIGFTLSVRAEVIRDIVYGHKDGMALVMDIYQPDGDANGAGVAYLVSAGFNSTLELQKNYEFRFMPLVEAGFTVFAVRHGSSPRYKVPDAYSDVSRAIQYIGANAEDFGVDPQRFGVFGSSAGGLLSLLVGLVDKTADGEDVSFRPTAVVAYMPPSEVRAGPNARFPALDFDPALAAAVSPVNHVSANDPPVLLVHGDADELVDISNSEVMHAALNEAGVTTEFVVIKGAPHGRYLGAGGKIANSAMLGWFQKYL
jgi:acetyl esterase/lipase